LKVTMVNDCAYVGETLIKFFPQNVETFHLKRSRGLWDKTFGIAWKIFRSGGDVFHLHYLLQDCYLALKMGKKPVIGHGHGSDLRSSFDNRVWRRIAKYNLEHCSKVLVATPDILRTAREYRVDAEYIPNPLDTTLFFPKPAELHEGRKKVLLASGCDWRKGTEIALEALSQSNDLQVSIISYGEDLNETLSLAKSLGLRLDVLPKTAHNDMRKYYWEADVVLDQFKCGSLGMVPLEAIACGRPVVTYVSSEYPEYEDFPLKDVRTSGEIVKAIGNANAQLWEKQYVYLKKNHDPSMIAKRIIGIYEELINKSD
jgi:glycosyltransferase involved in cell wall biosynthesis